MSCVCLVKSPKVMVRTKWRGRRKTPSRSPDEGRGETWRLVAESNTGGYRRNFKGERGLRLTNGSGRTPDSGHSAGMHPSSPAAEGPLLALQGTVVAGGWPRAIYHTHVTKEHTLRQKQGKMFPPKVRGSAQARWTLHLLVRGCSGPKAPLYG